MIEIEIVYAITFCAFLSGILALRICQELAPYVVFWYKVKTWKLPETQKHMEPQVVPDFRAYNQLTLRKRFVMEKDKRLN